MTLFIEELSFYVIKCIIQWIVLESMNKIIISIRNAENTYIPAWYPRQRQLFHFELRRGYQYLNYYLRIIFTLAIRFGFDLFTKYILKC